MCAIEDVQAPTGLSMREPDADKKVYLLTHTLTFSQ
jgi:hypothetical protein